MRFQLCLALVLPLVIGATAASATCLENQSFVLTFRDCSKPTEGIWPAELELSFTFESGYTCCGGAESCSYTPYGDGHPAIVNVDTGAKLAQAKRVGKCGEARLYAFSELISAGRYKLLSEFPHEFQVRANVYSPQRIQELRPRPGCGGCHAGGRQNLGLFACAVMWLVLRRRRRRRRSGHSLR